MFLGFLRIIKLPHIRFLQMFLVLLKGFPTKKTFSQHLYLSWETFWGISVLISVYACASVLESCSASYLMKFYTDAFCITSDSQCAKKNFVARITLYFSLHPLGILGLFWVYSWMSWETFSWYFARMSWYCCGDH